MDQKVKKILDEGRKIAWERMRGRPKSLSDRLKFSLAKLGKPRAGNPSNWRHSKKTKIRISSLKKGTPAWNKGLPSPWTSERNRISIGEKSPVWKGGVTSWRNKIYNSPEYKNWRKSVFERDNYTCVQCGTKSGDGTTVILNADHIKPFSLFPILRFELSNGRTLCVDCHQKTDTFGGRMNNHSLISTYA